MHALWVVVPARGIAQGKSRLRSFLDDAARERLNRWMLAHTLAVLAHWRGGLERCIVVSGCDRVLTFARRAGAVALREPRPSRGLNRAIAHAVAEARRRAAASVMILPVDLPRLSPRALDAAFAPVARGERCVIAPDAAGTGTNALVLGTRARFVFGFGAGSCRRHLEAARARGLECAVCAHPHFRLDVDTPEDLAKWRASGHARRSRSRVLYSRERRRPSSRDA